MICQGGLAILLLMTTASATAALFSAILPSSRSRLRSSETRPNAFEAMAEVTITLRAMVLGGPQVQRHQLVALTCVLEHPLSRSFDLDAIVLAMNA